MAIPDRSKDVDAICRAHPEAFPPGDANDPARLKLLTETMVPQINASHPEDAGNWGVLTKTDQGGKVPCDIMVWKPGTVTVDVMTGTGGSWAVQGSAPPAWVWTAVGNDVPTPVPPTPKPPASNVQYDEAQGVAFQQDVMAAYQAAGHPLDLANVVWSNRMTWDARDLGYTKSREKHLSQLKLELKG